MKYNKFLEDLEIIDQDHKNYSIETPLRKDAFEISDDQKISIIEKNVKEILYTLGMDMTDDSLKGTPKRVAKAYVNELFGGLNPKNLPSSSTFDNKYKYGEMLVEKNITVFSTCEHHLLPMEKHMLHTLQMKKLLVYQKLTELLTTIQEDHRFKKD